LTISEKLNPNLQIGKGFLIREPYGMGVNINKNQMGMELFQLSCNRRKPFVNRKNNRMNEQGNPIYYTIGYCGNKGRGVEVLAEYQPTPMTLMCQENHEGLFESGLKDASHIKQIIQGS
jgi:hypothetical protein